MVNMERFTNEINGIRYEMFIPQTVCFGECFWRETEFPILDRMRELEYISDTYTDSCVDAAKKTECYKNWQNHKDLIKASNGFYHEDPDPEFCLGPVGHQICSYKAIIISFVYMYFKENNIDWKSWSLFPVSITNYANNLYYLLRYISPYIYSKFETLPRTPTESCIGYVLNASGFHHAFLMVLEENYFVIYDAWAGLRRKWLRAMEKDQAIGILDKINDNHSNVKLRKELFSYFFDTSNFNSNWYIVYLPLESELFKDAYKRSIGKMLFHGGKHVKTKKKLKKLKKIKTIRVNKKCS